MSFPQRTQVLRTSDRRTCLGKPNPQAPTETQGKNNFPCLADHEKRYQVHTYIVAAAAAWVAVPISECLLPVFEIATGRSIKKKNAGDKPFKKEDTPNTKKNNNNFHLPQRCHTAMSCMKKHVSVQQYRESRCAVKHTGITTGAPL